MRTEEERAYQREWAKKARRTYTPEQKARLKAAQQKWRSKNVGRWREYSWNWQGIPMTASEFEKRLEEQDGRCAICRAAQADLPKPLHVDHDHTTGQVRGLLCQTCNRGLGHFHDNPALLIVAIQYLEAK